MKQPSVDPTRLERWGVFVAGARRWVLGAAVAVVVVGIGWGSGVFGDLVGGGFDDPESEAVRAGEAIEKALGDQDVDVIALYGSDTATVEDPRFRRAVSTTAEELRGHPAVESVVTYYDTDSAAFVSGDRHQTFAAIRLAAEDEDEKREAFQDIEHLLPAAGLETEVGGAIAFRQNTDELMEKDLARGEMFAIPVVLLLLVLIFGGAVAASLPVLIGMLSVLGALTATRLIAGVTDVSTFAVNTITLLGLGMAIDYSLLMVSRFRDELAAGHGTLTAVGRTVSSAGRTVLISGLTVILALASLLVFPQVFLRSMGLGGMAAVALAMIMSLTVLPALLAILGHRVNALRLPLPRRRRRLAGTTEGPGRWGAFAAGVMRRPIVTVLAAVAVLAVLASPFLDVEFGGVDERVMPEGSEPRAVAEQLTAEFPVRTSAPIQVFVDDATTDEARALATRIRSVEGVTDATVTAGADDASLIDVSYKGPRTGDQAYDAVGAIRDLRSSGVDILVGGQPALDVDRLDSLGARLPWVGLLMAGATLLLLFLAFGSVLLPIKAVAMNLVSIAAAFGVVVWVFQDGNLSQLLAFTPSGFIEPNIPILLLVVLFGLSTDYEVFLLARVREAWLETRDPHRAIQLGVQRTGGIITSAALLLIVVVAGFTAGQITFAKMIGVGMITALVVDATLVRMVMVPAVMRLMGRASWWLPGWLRRFHTRFGIDEAEPVVPTPKEPSLV